MRLTTTAGYELVRSSRAGDDATVHELVHRRTGARHFHYAVDDDNRCFCAIFTTLPADSTGVAHILEHSLLCGSRLYPHRPWRQVARRSLGSMNASTGTDRSLYYFNSRNPEDFDNLLAVYLDACFFPLLREEVFAQEGWRYELEGTAGAETTLRYRGVVFNEMKARATTAAARMAAARSASLFPGTTYAHSSGGDPRKIPGLTWGALREFHARHYHPANASTFSYGDLDLARLLDTVEERVLGHFGPDGERMVVPRSTVASPQRAAATFAIPDGEDPARRHHAAVAWTAGDAADAQVLLEQRVLASYLLDHEASPLRRALVASGLGSGIAHAGLDSQMRELVLGAGLRDTAAGASDDLLEATLDELRRQAGRADRDLLAGAVHGIELEERGRSQVPLPNCYRVLLQALPAMVHGGDVAVALDFDTRLRELNARRERGGLIEELAQALLDSAARTQVDGTPEPGLDQRLEREEAGRLELVGSRLDATSIAAIADLSRRVRAFQEAPNDPAGLPLLRLEAIGPPPPDPIAETAGAEGASIELYAQPTAGVTHLVLEFEARDLEPGQLELLPLLAALLPRLGTAGRDAAATSRLLARLTGGLECHAGVVETVEGALHVRFGLSMKCLDHHRDEAARVVLDLLAGADFETPAAGELLRAAWGEAAAGIPARGSALAQALAAARLTPGGALAERLGGRTALRRLETAAADPRAIAGSLAALLATIAVAPRLTARVTCEPGAVAGALAVLREGADRLPAGADAGPARVPFLLPGRSDARTISNQVAFNSRLYPTVRRGHSDAPALEVLGMYLSANLLYPEIRERGGAYGVGAVQDGERGLFEMRSGSDPECLRTFAVFDRAREFVQGPISQWALEEAVVATCRVLDPLESPDAAAASASRGRLAGWTEPARRDHHRAVLATTADDIRRVAARYLQPERAAWASLGGTGVLKPAVEAGLFEEATPLTG